MPEPYPIVLSAAHVNALRQIFNVARMSPTIGIDEVGAIVDLDRVIVTQVRAHDAPKPEPTQNETSAQPDLPTLVP